MKSNFLVSIIVLSFLGSLTFAQSFELNGEVRPRFLMDNRDFNSSSGLDTYTELRTRLGITFIPAENILGFIQFQDSRVFGEEPSTLANTKNIDLHQGYFHLKNLFNLPFNVKAGRMEVTFANQRLLGSVGWHNVGRSFDGAIVDLKTEKVSIGLVGLRTNESRIIDDTSDFNIYAALGTLNFISNYKIQPFVIGELVARQEFSRYTLGLYLSGNHGEFSHEIEGAYQLGTQEKDVDIAAYMFAVNAEYKFKTSLSPAISFGVDYLSGDDGKDTTKFNVFNTLYATNHKYYGYMDYFLDIPVNTYGRGLIDIHGKVSIVPIDKLTLALAYHLFNSNQNYILIDQSNSKEFGSEMDFTLIYQYNKAVKFQGGFSMFFPGEIFKETRGKDTANWGYIMAIVNL